MGGLGKRVLFDHQLREPQQAEKFRAAARQYGVAVPSMAMSGFFAQSFLTRDNYQDPVSYTHLTETSQYPDW